MKKKDSKNIFLIGPSGAGKSTIGKYLSKKLQMKFFDSDEMIKKKLGMNITQVFQKFNEQFFRYYEKKIISKVLKSNNFVLSTGAGCVLSKEIREKLKPGFIIYLKISIYEQMKRINNFDDRPLLKNKLTYHNLKNLNNQREKFYKKMKNISIDVSNKKIEEILSFIIESLKKLN